MNKNLTELVFILDRSGSMAGLEADTIGGFNGMIQRQRQEEGRALVSTVLFDHDSQVIHDRVELDQDVYKRQHVPHLMGGAKPADILQKEVHRLAVGLQRTAVHLYACLLYTSRCV